MKTTKNLNRAKRDKNDEFFTPMNVISKEVVNYWDEFEGKRVYCNCDDPTVSKFFIYFREQFKNLKLKKLIGTCYQSADAHNFTKYDSDQSVYIEHCGKKTILNGIDEKKIEVKNLSGDGDFRSQECINLLKKSDIIVTNPPFSLFREYVAQLIGHEKKFLIIGNYNSVISKEIFKLIQANKIWVGYTPRGIKFKLPGGEDKDVNACWFTNMHVEKRNDFLTLIKKYKGNEKKYPKYDNYDAIEVSNVKDIPDDYPGIMGVPITFFEKFNPQQFDVLGCTQRECHDEVPDTKKYDDYLEMRPDGTPTGSSGGKTNENANLIGNDGRRNYFIKGKKIVQSKYGRIFIKLKA